MQYLKLLHSCFRTNNSVRRSREELRNKEGLSARQANRFRGQDWTGLSEYVRNRCTAAAFCKCVDSVCVLVNTLSVLTYANSSGRKRAGVRMTEILSYQPDNLLPGHALLRKWRL